ncbi:THAP domain-containing protein 1-like isoform X2 [Sipha flava]|uniref:THAP domain-containing protein 1-like isoform X2 n=1 Tax=Sipha flava TaxID=143950 RepID=A0A8B8FRQ6_9HEMI|nr:THAP domain-containing protein 1-like isoform X2 [Sipha flava]XP_025413442.1 THAP domain-containing protein 1-like isoform X2 [Sipha flava]
MPGCAAINCSNSVTKGFLMKHFPKDKVRRKLWLVKMKRDNWSPTNYSCLCEIHFGEDMWEKTREDGSRRLKNDAVPTIFSFTKEKTKRKPPTYRQVTSIINNQVSKPQEKLKTSYQQTRDNDDVSLDNNLESNNSENQNKMKYESMLKKMLEYEKEYKRTVSKANRYKKQLQYLKNKLKISNDTKNTQMLNSVFNIDQINALNRNSTKFMKWSNSTVMKALKLKFSCGNNGYEELLKQNIPLPSLRTIRRRLQHLKCAITKVTI